MVSYLSTSKKKAVKIGQYGIHPKKILCIPYANLIVLFWTCYQTVKLSDIPILLLDTFQKPPADKSGELVLFLMPLLLSPHRSFYSSFDRS